MTGSDTNNHRSPDSIRRPLPALLRGVALVAAFGLGVVATYVATAPSALAATVVAGIDGGGSWTMHMHGHSHAQLHAHFEQVLTKAGATDAQKQQIGQIVQQAMTAEHADLKRYHQSLGDLKALLTAARIDDVAVAKVRADQDTLLLDTSHRLSETALQIARVLTPAQRAALGADSDRMMAGHMQSPGIGHHHGD